MGPHVNAQGFAFLAKKKGQFVVERYFYAGGFVTETGERVVEEWTVS